MAVATGIAPDVWAELGEQAIVTAIAVLNHPPAAVNKGTEAPAGWESL